MTEVQLPAGWSHHILSDVADITMGQSPPGSAYNDHGVGLPFFQGKAEFGLIHPTVKKWTTEGNKRAFSGDILMSVRAPVGPTNIADTECVIGRGLAAIRAREQMNQTFLLWFLRGVEGEIASRGTGTTFDSISGDSLRKQPVFAPPLPEQKEIVRILEEQFSRLDAASASITAVRRKADQFRRSLLHTAFTGRLTQHGARRMREVQLPEGWSRRALSDIADNIRESARISPDEEYELWSIPSFADGRPESIQGKDIGSGKLSVKPGDVLISKINPRINRVWLVKETQTSASQIASPEWLVARMKSNTSMKSEFLQLYLSSPAFRDWISGAASSVTGSHSRAKANQILEQMIPVPLSDEQDEIVRIVEEQFSRQEAILTVADAADRKVAALRRSLLHAAFSGELTKEWREKNNG